MINVTISDEDLRKYGEVYNRALSMLEKPLIEHALCMTEGNQVQAAKLLGINRNTLYTKIKKLGIEARRWKR